MARERLSTSSLAEDAGDVVADGLVGELQARGDLGAGTMRSLDEIDRGAVAPPAKAISLDVTIEGGEQAPAGAYTSVAHRRIRSLDSAKEER
jgi:hypothetical protein